jgi:hypothetical protein
MEKLWQNFSSKLKSDCGLGKWSIVISRENLFQVFCFEQNRDRISGLGDSVVLYKEKRGDQEKSGRGKKL